MQLSLISTGITRYNWFTPRKSQSNQSKLTSSHQNLFTQEILMNYLDEQCRNMSIYMTFYQRWSDCMAFIHNTNCNYSIITVNSSNIAFCAVSSYLILMFMFVYGAFLKPDHSWKRTNRYSIPQHNSLNTAKKRWSWKGRWQSCKYYAQ